MKKETYINLMEYMKKRKTLNKIIKVLYTALPFLMVVAYPTIIIFKGIKDIGHDFILTIVVPAVVLLGVSAIRKLINRPRPYEKFKTSSLISKSKQGQSFPSNHAACAFVIAMTAFSLNTYLAIALLIAALIIALTRIFSGVHFISDVIAGSAIGILAGLIFIFI